MKLHIPRNKFLKVLSHAQSIVERKNTLPILSHIKLEADNNSIRITATDMDLSIIETVEAEIESPGAIACPAHMLAEIVRKLPNDANVALDFNESNMRLQLLSGSAQFSLSCLPVAEFPTISDDNYSYEGNMIASELFYILDKVKFAIANEETRYFLNGVYLNFLAQQSDKMHAVATDGHRMAMISYNSFLGEGGAELSEDFGIIIPRKTVSELRRIIENEGENINIKLSPNKIKLTTEHIELTSKLIDGHYPDYNRFIPQNNPNRLKVNALDFADAIARVSVVSVDKSRAVKISVENNEMIINAGGNEQGAASESLQAEFNSSDALSIGFNAKYLQDILSNIEAENAEFLLPAEGMAPALISDNDNPDAKYVIMPMRV